MERSVATIPPGRRRSGTGARPRRARLLAGLVAALALGSLLPVSPSAAATSFDDTAGNAHEAMIELVAARGVTSGCSTDGRQYCPERPVTRAQMATFIAKALASSGVPLPTGAASAFPDVAGSPHEANIGVLAELGIVHGRADGTYGPADPVTRGQMALFIARAWQLPAAGGNPFTDVPDVYREAAASLAAHDISLGCDAAGTLYCPGATVRRDQMASFLGRAMALSGLEPAPGEPGSAPPPGSPPSGPTGPPAPPLATAGVASLAAGPEVAGYQAADHGGDHRGTISCAAGWFGLTGPSFDTPEPAYYYWVSEVFRWTGTGWASVAYGPAMWKDASGGQRDWTSWTTGERSNLQQWTTQGGSFTSVDHVWRSWNQGVHWGYVGGHLTTNAQHGYWCGT